MLPLSGNGVVASHSTILGWDASKSAVIGYNIYRTPATHEAWAKVNSSPIITTSYTDWDVQSGGAYLFAVTAVSVENVESGFSNATVAAVP
jgi:fibronectin type 3 domain-containing protein